MQGKVEICGVNTAKLPILKEEEKEALFARIKAGDDEAKEEYIKGNLSGSKCDQTILIPVMKTPMTYFRLVVSG